MTINQVITVLANSFDFAFKDIQTSSRITEIASNISPVTGLGIAAA